MGKLTKACLLVVVGVGLFATGAALWEMGSGWAWLVLGADFTLLAAAMGDWAIELWRWIQKKGGRL